MSEVHHLMKLF